MDYGYTADYPVPFVANSEKQDGPTGRYTSYKQTPRSKELIESHKRLTSSTELMVNFGDFWAVDPLTNKVHCRLDMGTTRIKRREDEGLVYEKSKYNWLLNPAEDRQRNPSWTDKADDRQVLTKVEAWAAEMAQYPNFKGLPTVVCTARRSSLTCVDVSSNSLPGTFPQVGNRLLSP
jgi:hypothetical protein